MVVNFAAESHVDRSIENPEVFLDTNIKGTAVLMDACRNEQMMVKYCDLAICDSVNIEKYIHECYDGKGIQGSSPKTTFIAYGADLTLRKLADDDEKLMNWYREKGLTKKGYYLVVGRFVPENSFEVMIREFMKSKSKQEFCYHYKCE